MVVDLSLQEHLNELKKRIELWKKQESIDFNDFAKEIETRDKIMHNMLVAIQSVIDIGDDLIRIKNLEMPSSYKEIFDILGKHNLIDKGLTREMAFLAGFRNVLVHLYWKIDLKKVHAVLRSKRTYLEEFYEKAVKFIK